MKKKYLVAKAYGINWMFYYVVEIDRKAKTIHEIDTWRAHKFDGQGHAPKTDFILDVFKSQYDIKGWIAAGRPGGQEGLRENYKKPDRATLFVIDEGTRAKIGTFTYV